MVITAEIKCVYFAVMVVILLVLVFGLRRWARKSEPLDVGYPYAYGASSFNHGWAQYPQSSISAGAYMKKIGQEMSQPKQGEYTTQSAMRVKGVEDFVWPEDTVGVISSPGIAELASRARSAGQESLVGSRGEPDFWELPQELRSAQVKQAGVRLESEKFVVGGNNTFAARDVDAYVYPHVY